MDTVDWLSGNRDCPMQPQPSQQAVALPVQCPAYSPAAPAPPRADTSTSQTPDLSAPPVSQTLHTTQQAACACLGHLLLPRHHQEHGVQPAFPSQPHRQQQSRLSSRAIVRQQPIEGLQAAACATPGQRAEQVLPGPANAFSAHLLLLMQIHHTLQLVQASQGRRQILVVVCCLLLRPGNHHQSIGLVACCSVFGTRCQSSTTLAVS